MNKIRLVTVTGSRTDTLEYMINHYWDLVDELHIVVYDTENKQYEKVKEITDIYSTYPDWDHENSELITLKLLKNENNP